VAIQKITDVELLLKNRRRNHRVEGEIRGIRGAAAVTTERTHSRASRYYAAMAITVFALFAVIFIYFAPAEHYFGYDIWEHAASLKQLMANPLHPLHPEYATYDSSRQYMPWNLLFAVLGDALRMSPLGVLALESIVTTALLLVGVFFFFREYFQNQWAPVAGLFCLLIAWGKPIVWSSFYDLWSYLMTAAYPSTFVFAAGFFVWWLGIRSMRRHVFPIGEGIGIMLLTSVIILAHQMSGAFVVAGLFCFVVAEPRGHWRTKLFILFCAALGMALTRFWPYFSPWQIAGKSQFTNPLWGSDNSGEFYRPNLVLTFLGPALAGVVALGVFVRRRIYLGVVLGFAGSMLGFVVGGIVGHPVAYRLIVVWIMYLHIACAWLLLAIFAGDSQPPGEVLRLGVGTRRAIAAAMGLLLLVQVGVCVLEVFSLSVTAFESGPTPACDVVRGCQRNHAGDSPASIGKVDSLCRPNDECCSAGVHGAGYYFLPGLSVCPG
jgi:hypothetical protein